MVKGLIITQMESQPFEIGRLVENLLRRITKAYNITPGVKKARLSRGVELYYMGICNNSGRNYEPSL